MGDETTRAQAEAAFGEPGGGRPRPSRAGLWIGWLLVAASVAGAALWFVLGVRHFSDRVDDLARVGVPGSRIVTLEEGRKSIYYEGPGGEDADVPPLEISVLPVGGGAALEVGEHSGSVTYSVGGHAGQSVAGLDVPRDGRYGVTVRAPSGAPPGAQLAVGPGLGRGIVFGILGGLAILFLGVGAGVTLVVVTAQRRSRAARTA